MRQSTKRLLSAGLSLIFLLIALIVFAYFLKPAYEEIQSLRIEVAKSELSLNNQKSLVEQFKNLTQDYENQQKNQNVASLILPKAPLVGEALFQIAGILNNNNLNLLSFNVGKPNILAPDNSSSTIGIKPIGTFDINLKASGDYSNFKNFLNQLETNIRLFDIKTLNINSVTNVGTDNKNPVKVLNYDITISAYYQAE
ncbi:MAG: hypothetical protein ACP5QN_02500 [Minisyncoccia bacterium]